MGYPQQLGGDPGCLCRTCGKEPAIYLDQCGACRERSTVAEDKAYLEPGAPALLEGWAVVYAPGVDAYTAPEWMVQVLTGRVYRHPRHKSGAVICTSPPFAVTAGGLIVTRSGTRYRLGAVLPEYETAVGGNAKERALRSLLLKE